MRALTAPLSQNPHPITEPPVHPVGEADGGRSSTADSS
jgi:hypothetical protein